jgi:hypothetical protein
MARKRGTKAGSLAVMTEAGERYELKPIPMDVMPSSSPMLWLKFQGIHIPGSDLSPEDQGRVQAFMLAHRTEALTDGSLKVTLAGGRLAQCFPEAVADAMASKELA